jgi:hypothetical protein
MAYSFKCAQFDAAYKPHRLGNWETPANREVQALTRPPGFKTEIIVDDNGHLIRGVPRRMTSFSTGYEGKQIKRWPISPMAPFSGASTMGYKGIQTDYLPTATVYLRNNPDSEEFNVRAPRQAASFPSRPASPTASSVRATQLSLTLLLHSNPHSTNDGRR